MPGSDALADLSHRPYDRRDLRRGEDGTWYHMPTVTALHRAGRLVLGSAAWLLLFPPGEERRCDA